MGFGEVWERFATAGRARVGRSERGVSLVEYVLLITLIGVICLLAIIIVMTRHTPRFAGRGSS